MNINCTVKKFYLNVLLAFAAAAIVALNSCNSNGMLSIGDKLPDYSGLTPEGDTMNLHAYFGKILLVNFWAGWCPDCRAHNPELVALYKQYKDFEIDGKKFDILSISLDNSHTQWKQNIESQGLVWPHHLSDFYGFKSEQLKPFKIHWIPSNYLVDENGVILAQDVDRSNFEKILREHYTN